MSLCREGFIPEALSSKDNMFLLLNVSLTYLSRNGGAAFTV